MYGLTVRWSLAAAPPDVDERLREYVVGTSLKRFTGLPGLRFKTWRTRPGEWFEGTYVFADAQARNDFEASFRESAPTAPGTLIIGSAPDRVERFDVVAVAEGGEGFSAGPGPSS